MTHLLLLDTSSLAYRAFFALPSSITDPSGQPVNAVRGYLDMTAQLVREHRPDRIIHVFDDDYRPAPRVAAYPGYKAERPDDPEGLPAQFELLAQVLDALGAERAVALGWEADDAIGALCAAAAPDDAVDVVTGDRDLLQLVRDEPVPVRVLYLGSGLAKAVKWGPEEVAEKYGVPVERAGAAYAELALLRGDPSDGLPGVPGIGEKTAATLLARYGSLENILAAAGDPKSSMSKSHRTKLLAAAEYIKKALPVVKVATDAELSWSTESDALPLAAENPGRVAELAETYGVMSSIGRLQKALDGL